MVTAEQLNTIIIALVSWATITTVILLLAKRDVILGLKKWVYTRFKRQPIKVRYYGADQNVMELIIPLKGKGEVFTMFDKKFFVKTGKGMTFFIDPKAMSHTDDGINEISYSYRSIMPIDPRKNAEEIRAEEEEYVRRSRSQEERAKQQRENEAQEPIEMDALVRPADPKRLNKLIEYIYLAAKADALAAATDVEKYVKWTLFGMMAVIVGVVVIYYTLDGKVLPLLDQIARTVSTVGSAVINA